VLSSRFAQVAPSLLGHCLVSVHSSSALKPHEAGTLNWGSHAARNRPNASAGPVFPRAGRSHPLCGPPIPGSSGLFRDDLAWVEIPTRINGGEEPVDHVHARSRNVLLQPRGMLGADAVVV
jgi:hypothetical protein